MQELIKVACKIRKSCRIKIYGDSLKHCATETQSLCVSKALKNCKNLPYLRSIGEAAI